MNQPPDAAGLDEVDRKIIDLLLEDARITNRDLADTIGIAPSTALMRTRSLVERGTLVGFQATVNLSAVGRSVQALVAVQLKAHDRVEIDRFTSTVPKLPEVLTTFHTSGSVDYLLHIAVPSTEVLRDWVLDNLTTDPVVGHTETTLVFERMPGYSGPLPQ
ncbi:DNA-binding Lrp family transcriptional regulator [Psychromicrobium silvestre]|uniref:DNA-binding Lrp family transcriptional regulator n=1 Tax=Psychromicrobium silvestre TaxID=1645614 RepID=A0A7Y9LT61_9MICC|nr:DNA-binding Lrp family transcriptional regulator [Psychromicrobium silvestre]